ncbi:MAG: ATP-binding protein, partial [Kangiellaceae bacterium]|nr:ATP-binding protein [Kangiellaceae bacterium]
MVSDTGIGIKEEDIPELFSQFTMFGDRQLNPNGSGFGLYISNLLLKSLGAEKIEVNSDYGFGTKFYFDLPIIAEFLVPLNSLMVLSEYSIEPIDDEEEDDDSSSYLDSVLQLIEFASCCILLQQT